MYINAFLVACGFGVFSMHAAAQAYSDTTKSKEIIYLLPDGSILEAKKLDSLEKAWGKVLFAHTKEDDEKGIVRLEKESDEIRQRLEDELARRKKAIASMLDKPAPDFELTDMQGNLWTLKKLRGKVVILNFWFTSCGPCIKEMPELNKLVQEYKDSNIVFLALTYNNAEQVKAFLAKRPFNYTQLPNSSELDKKYQISSWPTSMVIDKKGRVKMVVNSSPQIREELGAAINSVK